MAILPKNRQFLTAIILTSKIEKITKEIWSESELNKTYFIIPSLRFA